MTTLIALTQDRYAIVDKEDYGLLSQYSWYYDAYNKIAATRSKETRKLIKMHRLLTNAPDKIEVDHINGNPLDNRKSNLRLCTHQQNSRNVKLQKNNTSGYKGVTWDKQLSAWRVRVKGKFIGLYKDKYEAVLAYEKISSEVFKEFKRRVIV